MVYGFSGKKLNSTISQLLNNYDLFVSINYDRFNYLDLAKAFDVFFHISYKFYEYDIFLLATRINLSGWLNY